MDPLEYIARCAALRHRGLSVELMHQLQDAGNLATLIELEAVTDGQLVEMSSIYRGLSVTTQRLAREVLVRVPEVPLLWQDQGDQA